MAYVEILTEENKINVYSLINYNISSEEDSVVFTVKTIQFEKSYSLYTDEIFKTVESIGDCLRKIIEQIIQNNYILKIHEDSVRCYVKIGYETNSEFNMQQFSGSVKSFVNI